MKLFAIHDSKAKAYMKPFTFQSTGEAVRAFETSVREDKDSNLHKYPADFTLVELGTFDIETAEIRTIEKPLILSNAAEYIQ